MIIVVILIFMSKIMLSFPSNMFICFHELALKCLLFLNVQWHSMQTRNEKILHLLPKGLPFNILGYNNNLFLKKN